MNEKIYIFIWFWLLILGFLSSIVLFYRMVLVFSPYIRAYILKYRFRYRKSKQRTFLSLAYFFRRVKNECIDTVIGKTYVGDWLLFYLLGQNIDSVAFKVTFIKLKIIPKTIFLNDLTMSIWFSYCDESDVKKGFPWLN